MRRAKVCFFLSCLCFGTGVGGALNWDVPTTWRLVHAGNAVVAAVAIYLWDRVLRRRRT